MNRRQLFFFAPEGGSSADSSQGVLEHAFGPLASLHPDLAASEAKEAQRKADGKPPVRVLEVGRPVLDSEQPAGEPPMEGEKEKKAPPAREDAPPGTPSPDSGSDSESPDDETAALDAIVDKYQGKTRSMAKAVKGLRSLQTKTAEEKKQIEEQLAEAVSVIDRDYDWENGKPVLKPEAAARVLSHSGRPKGMSEMPSEEKIRSEVEAEFRKQALKITDEDNVSAVLAEFKPLIDQNVSERMKMAKAQYDGHRYNMLAEVGKVVDRHLREHPDDESIMTEVDALYKGVPEELRAAAVLEEWLPFGTLAEFVRIKKSLPQIVKDAYELGKKHRGEAGKATEAGTPTRSRPAPTNGRGSSSDAVRTLKENLVRGSGLPSIDEIFAK